jgi:hypothetical protein
MIRVYYSKIIYRVFFPYLLICFLSGGMYSLLLHRNDHLFFSEGFADVRDANKKLSEIKKMKIFNFKLADLYIKRGKALLDTSRGTKRERRNKKEFSKLRRKYL